MAIPRQIQELAKTLFATLSAKTGVMEKYTPSEVVSGTSSSEVAYAVRAALEDFLAQSDGYQLPETEKHSKITVKGVAPDEELLSLLDYQLPDISYGGKEVATPELSRASVKGVLMAHAVVPFMREEHRADYFAQYYDDIVSKMLETEKLFPYNELSYPYREMLSDVMDVKGLKGLYGPKEQMGPSETAAKMKEGVQRALVKFSEKSRVTAVSVEGGITETAPDVMTVEPKFLELLDEAAKVDAHRISLFPKNSPRVLEGAASSIVKAHVQASLLIPQEKRKAFLESSYGIICRQAQQRQYSCYQCDVLGEAGALVSGTYYNRPFTEVGPYVQSSVTTALGRLALEGVVLLSDTIPPIAKAREVRRPSQKLADMIGFGFGIDKERSGHSYPSTPSGKSNAHEGLKHTFESAREVVAAHITVIRDGEMSEKESHQYLAEKTAGNLSKSLARKIIQYSKPTVGYISGEKLYDPTIVDQRLIAEAQSVLCIDPIQARIADIPSTNLPGGG